MAVLLQVLATPGPDNCHREALVFDAKPSEDLSALVHSDDRLTSLALIHVHAKTVPLDAAEVVNKIICFDWPAQT